MKTSAVLLLALAAATADDFYITVYSSTDGDCDGGMTALHQMSCTSYPCCEPCIKIADSYPTTGPTSLPIPVPTAPTAVPAPSPTSVPIPEPTAAPSVPAPSTLPVP